MGCRFFCCVFVFFNYLVLVYLILSYLWSCNHQCLRRGEGCVLGYLILHYLIFGFVPTNVYEEGEWDIFTILPYLILSLWAFFSFLLATLVLFLLMGFWFLSYLILALSCGLDFVSMFL